MAQIYISITGLRLKALWHYPRFMALAGPAMSEAQTDPDCTYASARTIKGVHHTVTAWTSREAMRAYLTKPHHLRAMQAFPKIGTGKTYGYFADRRPSWDEARALWDAHATEVGVARAAAE